MRFWQRITGDPKARLSRAVLSELQTYRWPGNVRELKMVLMNLFTLFGAQQIGVPHLQAIYQFETLGKPATRPASGQEIDLHPGECLRRRKRTDEVLRAVKVTLRPLLWDGKKGRDTLALVRTALQDHIDELPVPRETIQDFLSKRTW